MDGYKAWKLYMAVKLHFTTNKYNVFNNRGHVKGARDTFYNRNDRFIFEKLARKFASEQDIIQYYVANFAYNNPEVVYSPSEADDNLTLWKRRKQSISQVFEDDLHRILLHMEKCKVSKEELYEGNPPELFKLFIGGFVTIETMVILNSFASFLPSWEGKLNLLWEEEYRRIDKSKGFVKFDSERLLRVYKKYDQELLELN